MEEQGQNHSGAQGVARKSRFPLKSVLFIGVLLFLGFSVSRLPASLAQQELQARLPQFLFSDPKGSIWNGQLEVFPAEGNERLGSLRWRSDLGSILRADPAIEAEVSHHFYTANWRQTLLGEVLVAKDPDFSLDIGGLAKRLGLVEERLRIEGLLNFRAASVSWPAAMSAQEFDLAAIDLDKGSWNFTGGTGGISFFGSWLDYQLAPLRGVLRRDGDAILVVAESSAGDVTLAELSSRDGALGAQLRVRCSLLNAVGVDWPCEDPDQVILEHLFVPLASVD